MKRDSLSVKTNPIKYSFGLDVSKEKIDVSFCILDDKQQVKVYGSHSFANTNKGITDLFLWSRNKCKEIIPTVYILEPTGIYHENVAWYLHDHDCPVSVVLPNKVHYYKKSLGLRSKNDSIDAFGLAKMGAEQNLSLWEKPDKTLRELRSITRHREDLVTDKTIILNRLEAVEFCHEGSALMLKQLKKQLALFEKQIDEIDQLIKETIEENADLKERFDKILVIKGVGLITLTTIIAETNGFDLITNQRQLTSYAGYDIIENQSGQHTGKTRISKQGNSHIRRILHMPAFLVVKYEPQFANLYERVYERTKIKMKAYVAVQRKLLILIYALWKNGTAYQSIAQPVIASKLCA
jgi:transposase